MMKNRAAVLVALTGVFIILSSGYLHAEVTFDWAIVGNPGNSPDKDYGRGRFGAVSYTYRISKHEVTNDQYIAFLNAVDPMGTNPNDVYSSRMGSFAEGGIAFNAAVASGSKYSSKINRGNKPVNFVSFFDAMRFVNWLENVQGAGSTESGVYSISDGFSETRVASATFFIPSEDEWYKAAYYDPRSEAAGGPRGDDNYWFHPAPGDHVMIAEAPPGGANSANYHSAVGDTTRVGAYTNTTGFYGTFDQGGNVWEWNEAVIDRSFRGVRGGGWLFSVPAGLAASHRGNDNPSFEFNYRGFRVASIWRNTNCDFNSDEVCDVDDLNAMVLEGPIASGVTVTPGVNDQFDLVGNGVIDHADVDQWLTNAATHNGLSSPYLRGDANLDGNVNVSDFNNWNSHKFTSTLLWDQGDYNGDGAVDVSDFNHWNSTKLTSSDGVNVVPEPTSLTVTLAALLALFAVRRS